MRSKRLFAATGFLLLSCWVTGSLQAQTMKTEFLKAEIRRASDSTDKLASLMALLKESYSLERDTMFSYAMEAKQTASKLHQRSDSILAEYYLVIFLRREGYSDSCLRITNQLLQKLSYQKEPEPYSKFKLLQIDIMSESGSVKDAIDSAFNFLKIAEQV